MLFISFILTIEYVYSSGFVDCDEGWLRENVAPTLYGGVILYILLSEEVAYNTTKGFVII